MASQTSTFARATVQQIKEKLSPPEIRNPFTLLCEQIAKAKAFHVPELQRRKKRVRLALVSLPPPKATRKEYWTAAARFRTSVDAEACRRSLWGYGGQAFDEAVRQFKEAITAAAFKHKAEIICVNELGFPARNQVPSAEVAAWTQDVANSAKCLIIAGSAHDRRTMYNSGAIFFPHTRPSGLFVHKQVSALAVDEVVSLPPQRRTLCTRVFGLQVASLICLDIADYSSVASVVRVPDRVDLLVLPCYTEWTDKMEQIARTVSAALPGLVAMANVRKDGWKPCVVTTFGKSTPPRAISHTDDGAQISIVSISVDDFIERKNRRLYEGQRDWLFGTSNHLLQLRS